MSVQVVSWFKDARTNGRDSCKYCHNMKTKRTIEFMTYFFVYNVFLPGIVLGLEYIHFDHKCRDITNLRQILTLNVNSLDECVEQSWLRQECRSVIYKRLFSICELYDHDISGLQPSRFGTSCTVIRREDIHLDGNEVLI